MADLEPEEGDLCPEEICKGSLEIEAPENCACHLFPPCSACVNAELVCNLCGYNPQE